MSRTGVIHFAKLENSPRLQRALAVLREYPGGLTTRQWQDRANLCNAHTCKSELNAQQEKFGGRIVCAPDGRSAEGSTLFRYRLAPSVMEGAA